jgi:hypothetical protein
LFRRQPGRRGRGGESGRCPIRKLICARAGGWEAAAALPFDQALDLLELHLKEDGRQALRHAQLCWHAALGLYARGGKPPDPPTFDED